MYLAQEADKLNTLDWETKGLAPESIACEVLARKAAYKCVTDILLPLVDVPEIHRSSQKDYLVDVK